ncbi:unnamed protein product [Linum trigynum]|uniref:Glutaredoxin domain-containing protein n=1 Tax=Linum trigynum TaxID=586398 RepID=A0AAV2CF12_9ROSI
MYTHQQQYHHHHESWRQSAYYGGGGGGGRRYHVAAAEPVERLVARLAAESAVVVFSVSSCCMCHAVKRLLCGLGVGPTVIELDHDPRGKEMERALLRLQLNNNNISSSSSGAVPVVFIGGKLVGAMDRVMASHINGTLVPLLKEAGALWL